MRIAIAGGSMAGLFSAALLQQAGHEVHVFERSRSGLEGRGAGLVAQEEVFTLLRAIGRDDVAALGVVARERITLDRAGAVLGRDPRPQMQVSWDHLYVAARAGIAPDRYHLGTAAIAAGQGEDDAWLELDDGTQVHADLVIGADGIGSAVRAAVLQRDDGPHYAGYVAWRALVHEQRLPGSAADLLSDRFAFFHMPGGQVLGYTVAGPRGELDVGERRYNAVWYRKSPDLAAALTDGEGRTHPFSLPPGGVSAAARAKLVADAGHLLPPQFAQVFAAVPAPFAQAIFDMETPHMADRRIALIGDAAFVARPHTAMGVAKAAGDAMSVAKAVEQGWTAEARAAFEAERLRAGRAIVDYGRRLGSSLA
jgi:2-polyprenyl-6-methoxyphenol hydroxylase-like FAD-dependent oxidoreductase